MDPLSITASVIAVIGAAGKAGKGMEKLISLRDAPEELAILISEVTDFRLLLNVLHDYISIYEESQTAGMETFLIQLKYFIDRAKNTIDQLDKLANEDLRRSQQLDSKGYPKVARIKWALNAHRIPLFQRQLTGYRANMASIMSAHGNIIQRKVLLTVQDCNLIDRDTLAVTDELKAASQQVEAKLHDGFSQHKQDVADVIESLKSHLDQRLLEATHEEMNMYEATGQDLIRRVEEISSKIDTIPSPEIWFENYLASSQTIIPKEEHLSPIIQQRGTNTTSSTICGAHTTRFIRVNTARTEAVCQMPCRCQCHIETSFQTPRWLRAIIGELFYKYVGTLTMKARPCNYPPCQKSGYLSSQFTYIFPQWIWARALRVSSQWKSVTGPGSSWTIRMPRVISGTESIWGNIFYGTTPQIQKAFKMNLASIYDIDTHGQSLALYATGVVKYEILHFLAQEGADLTWEDENGNSVLTKIWMTKVKGDVFPDHLSRFLIEDDVAIEQLGLTRLHLAVAGLSGRSIVELFQDTHADVNVADRVGNTPLLWAAQIGDIESVEALLDWGANPAHRGEHKRTAFHIAARNKNVEIVRLLLQQNSTINLRDCDGATPLIHLCWGGAGAEAMEVLHLLLDHGADVDAIDNFGEAALHAAAAVVGSAEMVQVLLDAGASVDNTANLGRTALLATVTTNQLDSFLVLLHADAKLDTVDNEGCSILHHAALFASAEMISLIARMAPSAFTLDINAQNQFGRTPLEALLYSHDRGFRNLSFGDEMQPWHEVVVAFYSLLAAFAGDQEDDLEQIRLSLIDEFPGVEFPVSPLQRGSEWETVSESATEQSENEVYVDALEEVFKELA